MRYGPFNAQAFRLHIVLFSDAELIVEGKKAAPDKSRWGDPVTISHNAEKYEPCKQEWRRRHPKRPKG